ncbi:MAG: ATP-binding protein, partial [Rhodospirillaceae bacterium]
SASSAALSGGGHRARPGEISLAHNGILFLDELPEFQRAVLESLRQPLETGRITIARANGHVSYPARVQLVAAMNPCRCGHLADPALACSRAPRCAQEYQNKLSGPLLDRIDLHVEVPAVSPLELGSLGPGEPSAPVRERVCQARALQEDRARHLDPDRKTGEQVNARADGALLDRIATPDSEGLELLTLAAERLRLSARGYHRVLRVARTIADLEGSEAVRRSHIAETLNYRQLRPGMTMAPPQLGFAGQNQPALSAPQTALTGPATKSSPSSAQSPTVALPHNPTLPLSKTRS